MTDFSAVERPVILFRPIEMDDTEEKIAKAHFELFRERTAIRKGDLIIPRYSALPYYEELQADADYVGAQLVNTRAQHNYIADMRNWVEDLHDLTPKTWYRLEDIDEEGPYVLKGKTNSKKFDWDKLMFAKDRQAAGEVLWRLSTDGLIGQQDIYIRKFEKFKTYFEGINGLPVTHEFRFFTFYGRVICGAFYWSNYADDLQDIPRPLPYHVAFVETVLQRIAGKANFVVIDIAEDETGKLRVVELNDGGMSGLSMNDPDVLYQGLRDILTSLRS